MAISEDLSVIETLKQAARLRLEISERTDKPNMSVDETKAVIELLPAFGIGNPKVTVTPNLTKPYQPYYAIGRDEVFEIKYKVFIPTQWQTYYIKGFFFNKQEIIGVYLISARVL